MKPNSGGLRSNDTSIDKLILIDNVNKEITGNIVLSVRESEREREKEYFNHNWETKKIT